MKEITLKVNESKFKVFLEFIRTLDYVEVDESTEKFIAELTSSLAQVKQMKEGNLPKHNAKDFLNGL